MALNTSSIFSPIHLHIEFNLRSITFVHKLHGSQFIIMGAGRHTDTCGILYDNTHTAFGKNNIQINI